jgi:formate hydrogenlyase transcriptional activator
LWESTQESFTSWKAKESKRRAKRRAATRDQVEWPKRCGAAGGNDARPILCWQISSHLSTSVTARQSRSSISFERNGRELYACQQYRTLLAVSQAIVSHRDLATLFHDLAGRLHLVVRFDYLACVLHDATSNSMRLHVLETTEPIPAQATDTFSLDEDPAGIVLQTQQPVIVSNVAQESRWPRFPERAKPFGVNSLCFLPLTTARRRLGALVFACKQAGAYDRTDLDFLQQVANQVAVAVENALAFDKIEALKDKLHHEKVYLEEEVRTAHNFGEIIGESASLRRVLNQVEAVAPTGATVLILGETGTGKELIARALHDLSPRRRRRSLTPSPNACSSWTAS